MGVPGTFGKIVLFCVKFLVLLVVCLWVWLTVLPWYGVVLGEGVGLVLRGTGLAPIESTSVEAAGFLNTESTMTLAMHGQAPKAPFALAIMNVAPFLALVLATSGISWTRRLLTLMAGMFILVLGHVVYLCYLAWLFHKMVSQPGSMPPPDVLPQVASQFFVILPFLLWVVLAYWDRLAGYFAEDNGDESAG